MLKRFLIPVAFAVFSATLASQVVVQPGGGSTFTGGTVTSPILFPDGTSSDPSISFSADPNTGFYRPANGNITMTGDGFPMVAMTSAGTVFRSDSPIGFASGGSLTVAGGDLFLWRDAANTLAQRNGTNAQQFNLYNTYTSGASYTRLEAIWSANQVYIQTRDTGAQGSDLILGSTSNAAAGSVFFRTGGTNRWQTVYNTGHLLAVVDDTYDIGASGANRPRSGFFGTGGVQSAGGFKSGGVEAGWSSGRLTAQTFQLTTLFMSATAPTIASGGCTSPVVTWNNGTATFLITIGTSCTGVKTFTLTLPAASNLWHCKGDNNTSDAAQQTNYLVGRATSTTAVVMTSYDRVTGLQEDFTDSNTYLMSCSGG